MEKLINEGVVLNVPHLAVLDSFFMMFDEK